ncbi:MAG: LamG-like jellyroll fold domain-containing protein, partial [Candidatus Thorarchaeota archaeon]
MRKAGLLVIFIIILFLVPSVYSPQLMPVTDQGPSRTNNSPVLADGGYALGTGTGQALNTLIRGTVVDGTEVPVEIDSDTMTVGTIGISGDYTATGLGATLDTFTMTVPNALRNPSWNTYHQERWHVGSISMYDDQVTVPNYWTLTKSVGYEMGSYSPHPLHGDWELNDDSSGYAGTRGWRFEAEIGGSDALNPDDAIYLSQQVHAPWRELYSVQISFLYYVTSSSDLYNQTHLFTKFAGIEDKFLVFESGDTTNTWLPASATIPSSELSSVVLPDSLLFEIGLGTDVSGALGSSRDAYAYIDEIQLELEIRPFPEQVGLRVNGTEVVGSTAASTFPYVPKEDGRDCWDYTSGIDLDGYNNDARPEVGLWGTFWNTSNLFELGLQFPLDIPQGAVIERAYLEMESSGGSGLVDMRVHMATNNSAGQPIDPFSNHVGLHLEDEFDWFDTSIDWMPDYWSTNVRYASPDIAPLLQKAVSAGGWTSGQYVAVMLSYMWSSSYQYYNNIKGSYDASPSNNFTQQELSRLYVWYRNPHSDDVISAEADYARSSLQYKKDITVDHTKVSEDLTDFPVLVDIYDSDLKAHVKSGGADIAFSVGNEFVEHEIELFNQNYSFTDAHLVAWVKIPTLSSTVDTVITMFYGGSSVGSLESSGVWDDYEIVQHMNDAPNGTICDSTNNQHSGPSFGDMTYDDLVSGAIGTAIDFDGSNDVISAGQIDTDEWTDFTITGWVYQDAAGDDRIFSKAKSTDPLQGIMHFAIDGSQKFTTRMVTDGAGGGASGSVSSVGYAYAGSWHYLSWSWSAATTEMRLHLNGSFDRAGFRDGDSILDSYVPFVMGNWQTGTGSNRFFGGMIDEIRMTNRVLSDGWIATEFANQVDPAGFYVVDSEQSNSPSLNPKSAALVFSTESPLPVWIGFTMSMDFDGSGKSLDENLDEGTTFHAVNGTNIVEWRAKVLVSPPPGITQTEVHVDYPATEWKPISLTNPLGQSKTTPSDWTYTGGRITINPSGVDIYGLWTITFEALNYLSDLQLGLVGQSLSSTGVFQTTDSLRFQGTSSLLAGSATQLFLTDPTGSTWGTPLTNTTIGSPDHKIPSFAYRKVITVDFTKVHDDLTHFPVYLDIVDADLHDRAQDDGDDIVFVQNGNVVPHELIEYNPAYSGTEARITAWVQANLTALADTEIEMYYGNSVVGPQELPDAVWSNGYVGVWHLEESPSGTTGEIKDSTSYRNDGTTEGTMDSGDLLRFRESEANNLLRVSDSSSLDSVAAAGTIQLWIWFDNDAADGDRDVIMESSNRFNGNPNDGFEWSTQEAGNIFFYPWGGVGNNYNLATNPFANGTWHHLAVTLDYSIRTDLDSVGMYIDSSFWSPIYRGVPVYWTQIADLDDWLWGGDPDMPTRYFDGRFDEIRVSNTVRSVEWLETEYDNQNNPSTFYSVGAEVPRDPDSTYYPSFSKTLDNTAAAGIWTATIRFNDSGSSIDYRVGIYEREFIVKHPTSLTLLEPSETTATAGDWIYIEYEFSDNIGPQLVPGATVTINWTVSGSGTQITLDDYNTGVYGKILNTADLEEAKRWRVNIEASHPFYNNATGSFDLDLYHATSLQYGGVTTTPMDFDFTAVLTFTDTFDNVPINGATIVRSDAGPLTVNPLGQGKYNISIETTALSPGNYWYILNATKSATLIEMSSVNITFTLRRHYTSVSVQGNLVRPHGFDTPLHIVLTDLDTGGIVSLSDVTTFSFDPASYGIQNRAGSSYDVTLITNTWNVANETVTLTVVMSGTKYYAPQAYSFDVNTRAHTSSATVSGVVSQPFGNVTPLTVLVWDHDTEDQVPIGEIGEFSFAKGLDITLFSSPSSYDVTYDTSDWDVGIWSITLSIDIPSNVYENPSDYNFDITIRSMTTVMYHDPTDLVLPAGVDFTIGLRANVSEPGSRYRLPVRGLIQSEFSVSTYAFSIDTTDQNIGRYNLTISWTELGGIGVYTITVYLNPMNASHGPAQLVITFRYRDVISTLTSPNYPLVTTPYQTDVQILLNYTDIDGGVGIDSATVSSLDHPEYIANWTDVGGGIYSVWLDVSTLAKGTYYFDLTVSRASYTTRTLEFQILIRIAYTYAIPTVGALDIPLGNSPTFYVDYWDIDHDVPVDNSSAPYSKVLSTWHNFSVTYVPAQQRYSIEFMTSDSDSLSVNQIYTFNFSRGENYQFGIFNVTVTIRTHNTDFRLTSAIEPTSNIGTINMTVYYGDLDNGLGIDSGLVDFSVENVSGLVVSTFDNVGGGFYVIHVDADQFGLGLQTFTVYADWIGPVAKYQDRNFATTANVVGLESSLTLLLAAEPTPYQGDMSYKFFYSDLSSGLGIDNLTGNVFVYVSFQGESVDLSQVGIIDYSATQAGNYSIQFNNSIFDRTGLIYMNLFVNWSKGVAPYYQNRTDIVSIRVLPRDTLLSVAPPTPTSYGENATFTFTYEDVAGGASNLIGDSSSLTIIANVSFSHTETAGTFEIEFNTTEFAGLGQYAIRLDVIWSGLPFYANRTNKIVLITIIARQSFLEYLTPAPTQYSDIVSFDVTWTDITGGTTAPITGASLGLYDGAVPLNVIYYNWTEVTEGVYSVDLSAIYHPPGTYSLTVSMSAGVFYIDDDNATRLFSIRERITLFSAEPVRDVPYNSSIEVILYYQDLFTTDVITNGSGDVTLEILSPGVWYSTVEWNTYGYYVLSVATYDHPELLIGPTYNLNLTMSHSYSSPYYASDDLIVEYEIRVRDSSLEMDSPPVPTAYANDATFTIFYNDVDADAGIADADISVYLNATLLVQGVDYTISQGSAGYYTLDLNTTSLTGIGLNILNVSANWVGAPYHENLTTNVNVIVRERSTIIEITQPPSQTQYLDKVNFTFVYNDLDAGGSPILGLNPAYLQLTCENGTPLTSGYSFTSVGVGYELSINSAGISAALDEEYQLTLAVDWDGATAPFYADRSISLRLSIVGRAMKVDSAQSETKPITGPLGTDNMTISFRVLDAGNDDSIEGAMILISCQERPSFTYWITYGTGPLAGHYNVSVDTASLVSTGVYHFDLQVNWNPLIVPYYSNSSTMTLIGEVDRVDTNLQAEAPVPSSPQIGEYVNISVSYTDLDHGQANITGANFIVTVGGVSAQNLTYPYDAVAGVYRISFSTANVPSTGSYTVSITGFKTGYDTKNVKPSVNVRAIETELIVTTLAPEVYWKDSSPLAVEFWDTLNNVLITGASVNWSVGSFEDSLVPVGPGYQYTIDTFATGENAGQWLLTIQARLDNYQTQTIFDTLLVLNIPSEMDVDDPGEGVYDINRGDSMNITIYLRDPSAGTPIEPEYVEEDPKVIFEGSEYYLTWNTTLGYYIGTLPGSATAGLNPGPYTVRITANLRNYELALNQFKINVREYRTVLHYWDNSTSSWVADSISIRAVFLEDLNYTVRITAPALGDLPVDDANVFWVHSTWNVNLTFTNLGNGVYSLLWNTDNGTWGTWGLTFRAIPTNATFGDTSLILSLTIGKIPTEVVTDALPHVHTWGWKGNISFYFKDNYYVRGISGANATYSYGTVTTQQATDLGNGTYLVYVDTTLLSSRTTAYDVFVTFDMGLEYEIGGSGARLVVTEVPTRIELTQTGARELSNSSDEGVFRITLEVPIQDSIELTFFYNDTDLDDGFVGGLAGSWTNLTQLFGGYARPSSPELIALGNGYYTFIFDTEESWLFETVGEVPTATTAPYVFDVRLSLPNRREASVEITINVINIPTELAIVESDLALEFGAAGQVVVRYWDTWHDVPITNANVSAVSNSPYLRILETTPDSTPGQYRISFVAETGFLELMVYQQSSVLTITSERTDYQTQINTGLTVGIVPTPFQETMNRVIPIAFPVSLLFVLLLAAYIRVWSVPKRIRQINAQVKALRKGKIPKPIDEVPTRQEILAELFNDTYSEVDIKRAAHHMPEESVAVEVPEMGELLIQLSILTHLSAEELEEFKGDIDKMRMSERATFVKEVIMQEAMRAARRDETTVDEVIEQTRVQALRQLRGEEEGLAVIMPDVPEEKPIVLVEEEEKEVIPVVEEEEVVVTDEAPSEEPVVPPEEKLSEYEIEELRKELTARGVPPHEIDTIME